MYRFCLHQLGIMITLLALAFLTRTSCQATIADLPYMNRTVIEQKILEAESGGGRLRRITGEVLVAGKTKLTLCTEEGVIQDFSLTGTDLYLNGQPSSGEALRPVYPGRNFQARLYVDEEDRVKVVEAWYIGGEGQLVRLHPPDGDGYFSITLRALDTPEERRFLVSQELNEVIKSIPPETCLYYQLNLNGEIGYILLSP
ncbi:MAG TPA: hypothetical protein VIL66_01610 [Bacillota bacterium]